MRILLIADIHGNFPALTAVAADAARRGGASAARAVVNCGDSVVYAPFANETMDWLGQRRALSILGNTDRSVIRLLRGKGLKKPRDPEKRIMYEYAAAKLSPENALALQSFGENATLPLPLGASDTGNGQTTLGVFHGGPDNRDEFLFADTPDERFAALADNSPHAVIVCGHSHTPFWKYIGGRHFINPGSVGRMFDGNPQASYALLDVTPNGLTVGLFRVSYDLARLTGEIRAQRLPEIYVTMYESGRKLN
ncbi:MAG: metallophosphatase family protein [Desulfobulbaceae bacterium]|jgi:predicted phosphodiesterase|nr:metallophosphatase family protein [Desulfobulbaceae bacterium]